MSKQGIKLIVAGSRTICPMVAYAYISSIIKFSPSSIVEIIEGGADGVDRGAKIFALVNRIPLKTFPADWRKYRKLAGRRRNYQMSDYGDVLFLLWDGLSKGSKHMKQMMNDCNKAVWEHVLQ